MPAAFRAAHQRQRTVCDVGEHVRRDRPVVIRQLLLGELRFRVENFVGMCQADRRVFGS